MLYIYNNNNPVQADKYKIDNLLRDDAIIKVVISKGKNKFTLRDSLTMLNGSLLSLGKSFGVDTIKGGGFDLTNLIQEIIYFI